MATRTSTGPSGSGREMSEYERQRLENIKEMQGQFSDLFDDVKQSAEILAKSTGQIASKNLGVCGRKRRQKSIDCPSNKRTKSDPSTPSKTIVRRSARIIKENRKSTNYNEESDSDSEKTNKKIRHGSLLIKFPWSKKNTATDEAYYSALGDDDFINDDDEEYYYNDKNHSKRTTRRSSVPIPRLPVSKVTEEMLSNITYSSVGKQYSANGTTCHQCRQKTLDQKSYCRYKKCRGVRGMFCGFCLGNRYGENVAEVLLNEKWACPPCRGYCNCSICRRKNGRNPTGQLAPIASAQGYKSVRHLLNNLEGEESENNISSDSEIEDEKNEKEDISKINCNEENKHDISKGSDDKDNEQDISKSNSEKENKPDISKVSDDKENEQDISKGNSENESDFMIKNRDIVIDEQSELTNGTENSNKKTVNINSEIEKSLETNDVRKIELDSCNPADLIDKIYQDLILSKLGII
uniref:Cell division cycle-associated 7-like protein n=1 Tax=Sipha flava TaxID=143950 RepID=A0A2S2QEA0_9HEMI